MTLDGAVPRLGQHVDFAVPSDERRQASPRRLQPGPNAGGPNDPDTPRLRGRCPSRSTGPRVSTTKRPSTRPTVAGAGHHLARLGHRLETGGQVHRLSQGHGGPTAGTSHFAHDHQTAVDPDAHLQPSALVEHFHLGDDLQGGPQGLLGVVVMGFGPAEPEQDSVAAVALDVAGETACDRRQPGAGRPGPAR